MPPPRSERPGDDTPGSAGAAQGPDGLRGRLRAWVEAGDEPWYRRWRVWVAAALGAGAGLFGLVALLFAWFYLTGHIPPADELVVPEPTRVVDVVGRPVATLDPAAIRGNVELSDLPQHLVDAVLAAEDEGFHGHAGFSVEGVARAAWANLTSFDVQQGGSTITQQYVELAVEDVGQSPVGKLRELALAVKLDRQLSKDQILESYLNGVPLGRGAIGIEAAATSYFGKPAAQLTLNEAATLAGLIRAPSAFAPARNPDAADLRRRAVLENMAEEGFISPGQRDAALAEGLPPVAASDPVVEFDESAYYLDAVRRELEEILPDHEDVFTGLEVKVAMDLPLQQLAQQTLRERLGETGHTGAIVTVDPASGGIRALVGGLDYGQQRFNSAVQARRQAGSSFKPFTLATFVAQGWSPTTRYEAPEQIRSGHDLVHNYSGRGHGTVTVRTATEDSINTVYAQLAEDVGPQAIVATASGMGITSDLPIVPSISLGTGSVSPLEMAGAYATLAADGVAREPHVVVEVTDQQTGEVLHSADPEDREAIVPNVAHVVTDVLRDVIESGTGTAADIGRPAVGKTGTTDEFRDAWFAGYVPQLATAVWVGNLDNSPMDGISGGDLPAETWQAYMSEAVAPLDEVPFPEPDLDVLEPYDTGVAADPAPSPAPTSPSPQEPPPPTPGEPSPSPQEPSPTSTTPGEPSPTPGEPSPTPAPSPSPSPPGDQPGPLP